jgi:hypothetical protein
MAVSSTTFKKGQGKAKGTKSKKTLLKEKVGISTWNQMEDWLLNAGMRRYKREMMGLKGKDFIYAHATLMEYVKPKLNRTTLEGGEKPIGISKVTFE